MALSNSQSKGDGKPHRELWKVVPTLLFFLFFAYQHDVKAVGEKDTARRQEIAFGNILDCKAGGKGGKYCHDIFQTANDQSYVGASLVSSDVAGRSDAGAP